MHKGKNVIRIVGLMLLAAIVGWCASRWNVWFHNPEEAPYTPLSVPTRVLLTFGDEDGIRSRNVSWMCGEDVQASYVELINLTSSLSPLTS